ncbi:MAG TPA: glycosyltransferase family 39 protein [Polyangiaceae bacterium]|nr:glycosyltransferase family 39 protein [Polyangiaceae bacterium]
MPEPEPNAPDASVPEPPLVPPGHPLRPRALVLALLPSAAAFLLMSTDRHFTFSVPVGAALCVLAVTGVLDFLGTFDDAAPSDAGSPPSDAARAPGLFGPRMVELLGSLILCVAVLRLVVAGRLPFGKAGAAVGVTGTVLWTGVAVFRLLGSLGIVDESKPLRKRWGFWLFVLNVLLYVPLLGAYSLSDPWETHYGEVAREMLARDDWISTWWAQENWFWSKPVLDFWLQALSFSALGVRFLPDEMIASVAQGLAPRPEWAARLPVFLLMLPAVYLAYRAVARHFGERAGFLGALVLSTAPHWYVIGRQSMTDMPYVAPLTAALACVMLGLAADPEATAPSFALGVGTRTVRVSAFHLVSGLVAVTVLPQALYLFSRHLTLSTQPHHFGFHFHADEILFGSPGNCGLPGNDPCHTVPPVDPVLQPGLLGVVWLGVLGLFLWINRGERRTARLYFIAAWYCTALATLAKGAPGLVLPIAVTIAAVGAMRRWKDFARLEFVGMTLVVASVCLPWYVQMYVRHGPGFTDRLLFHDMYKRAFVHVHDTNTGDDVSFRYYVWQLGYGLFPWTGLAVAGLLGSQRDGDEAKSRRAETLGFLLLWFVVAFSLFTISLTKFHHYILPAVPPIALFVGLLLDRALPALAPRGAGLVAYLGLMAGSALLCVGAVLELGAASLIGQVPPPGASPLAAAVCAACGVALFALAVRRWPAERIQGDYAQAVTALFGLAAAAVVLLVGRDLSSLEDPDGPARFTQLASYNYARPWPLSLDFHGVLGAITAVTALATALFAAPRLRHHAAVLVTCVGVWAAVWALDVYLVRSAPHWGQRETIAEYYKRRTGPEEPLAAYQMNWKGENFYTGNHVPAFISTGAKFKSWVGEERDEGTRVVFFVTEHSRESTLKSELGKVKKYEKLTTKDDNNKFFLARVEL